MGILRKLFGTKGPGKGGAAPDPAKDPNLIRVYDGYGREVFITREQWRDDVLLGNLDKKRNNPDELYNMLVGALEDGFAADIVPYAEHLHRTEPLASRGVIVLGIVYMKIGRLDDAERVFNDFMAAHGEEGFVLTNLAKVYSERGDDARAEAVLWHALELEPNQDNGLEWYAVIQRERGGMPAAMEAYRRVAALPQSWRAQLWLARDALQHGNFESAEALYREALSRAPRPVPTDLMMQMSGDLGNAGHLEEIVRLTEPYFDPAVHGLQAGNNLIKAYFELGRTKEAHRIVEQLYAQKRPDWTQTLSYWDNELAKAGVARRAQKVPEKLSATVISIQGPLWIRGQSPLKTLLPVKQAGVPNVAVIGSTVLLQEPPGAVQLQRSNATGRLSRAVPLFLADRIHLLTQAIGTAEIAWIQEGGFAVFGRPYDDAALGELVRMQKEGDVPGFVAGITLDASEPNWKLILRLLRSADGKRLADAEVNVDSENPGPGVEELGEKLLRLLAQHAGVSAVAAPAWYATPRGNDLSDFLLRLEQQLALTCAGELPGGEGSLSGEREIFDGIVQLCVRQPANATARMVLARTLLLMKKLRPDIFEENRQKVELLQRDHPIGGEVGQLIESALAELLSPS
jgi:tetratricopeptide (TPR) repeat protein